MNISTKILNELDHPDKYEDYTNTSYSFGDIFLNGDYIMSKNGHKIVYRNLDDVKIIFVDNEDSKQFYSARSRDSYHWSIIKNGQFIEEKLGRPITIAQYIADLNDTI